jgi:hypothetical protein
MKFCQSTIFAAVVFAIGLLASPIGALDPCGMVPPIYTGPGVPIVRTGLQQTYVFHKDGVETFVIKPGFQGRVEDFGMLIPFPTPPALRKVPDSIFEQIDNAIDPPEVVVDLSPQLEMMMADGAVDAESSAAPMQLNRRKGQVVVLKEEAVGMYEVAVLEAGSPEALKAWMDQHGYQYPKGMDKVTGEYIESGWCFVAVKTKVGRKKGADPAAGQRKLNTQKPEGTVFDGTVQGMGFRFKSENLVVPMRLSAFNDGDLRNVVYLLTENGQRIRNIPEEYVVRQVTGQQLLDNITKPLPLRIIGGTEKDIPEYRRKTLKNERDPEPKNGVAKILFSSDLLAVSQSNLSLEMEEDEKALLAIGEHMGLRGIEYDLDIATAQKEQAKEISDAAIEQVAGMTLTLVDGDFPRQVIANQNLKFADYNMPSARNKKRFYDATLHGPGVEREGRLISSAEIDYQADERRFARQQVSKRTLVASWVGGLFVFALGMVVTRRFLS